MACRKPDLSRGRDPHDASKTQMAGRGVERLGVSRRRAITAAVIGRAEMRAALDDLARDLDVGLARVVTALLGPAARVLGNAARLWRFGFMLCGVPVRGPFPDIADHVVQAV